MTEEPSRQSAAAAAAEKVRAIVEAAERSAAELEAEAREDAVRIRAEAEREADSRLSRARETAARLGERARELERQVAAIRASIVSLGRELEELSAEPAKAAAEPPKAGADPAQAAAGPAQAAAVTAGEVEPVASVAAPDPEDDVDETIAAAEAAAARGPEIADQPGAAPANEDAPEPVSQSGSGEGARVIALNMALSGTPRDETARYLAENFELDDPDALLDDVYARAGG